MADELEDSKEFVAIPIAELRQHIDWLTQEVDPRLDGFTHEFNRIERRSESYEDRYDKQAAEHDSNKKKNRYANVMPWDHSRVILDKDDGSDYINANYIELLPAKEKRYIACQGPLSSTCNDFWHMIWSESISVVVMLTKLKENDRSKCFQYWPEDEPEEYDSLRITPLETTMVNDSVLLRRFSISNNDESRELNHFQYVEWPDHGTPHNTARFRELLRCVDEALSSPKEPILVHCSAGIGRTGTFCVVHSTLTRFREEGYSPSMLINVPSTVLELRMSRAGMVQTKDQYMFCYLAILEAYEEWQTQSRQPTSDALHPHTELNRSSGCRPLGFSAASVIEVHRSDLLPSPMSLSFEEDEENDVNGESTEMGDTQSFDDSNHMDASYQQQNNKHSSNYSSDSCNASNI